MQSLAQVIGLRASQVVSGTMPLPHLHPEVELNLALSGRLRYVFASGPVELPSGRLAAFWGGYPHRLLTDDPVELLWATVPLSAVAAQPVLRGVVERLLQGELLYGGADEREHDLFLLRRWERELAPTAPTAHVCLLEMQARLARLMEGAPLVQAGAGGDARVAERMLAFIARFYTGPLSVARVAEGAGAHPTYAALAFKQVLGMAVWEYVTHLRVAHARRLLAETDWGVDRVALASGFQTRSSFYRAFRAACGMTPKQFRQEPRADGPGLGLDFKSA